VNPISTKIIWKYQKNKHLINSFIFRNAPNFVYASDPEQLRNEIPVFTFHSVTPYLFEEQCRYLAENGYRTLSAAHFADSMRSKSGEIKDSILLSFDDGLSSLWTIAFPLLKKYGLKATCFILPGCIPDDAKKVRPTLEDCWHGTATLEEAMTLEKGPSALANWNEIKIMHESGIVDFQSHTMYHSLVFTSKDIFDFMNPGYDTYFFGNIHVPLYSKNGKDVLSRDPVMGMPIYYAKPRLQAERRYYDDEDIRSRCVEMVKREGKQNFFKNKRWRRILKKEVSDLRKTSTFKDRYETVDERDRSVYHELRTSKEIIESKLPGKRVEHLCFPWYQAADFAVEASKRAGFKVNYFGQIKRRPTNRPGDNIYRIVRVEDVFLKRLPGKGRENLGDVFTRLRSIRRYAKSDALRH
jgi:hypothetical protein